MLKEAEARLILREKAQNNFIPFVHHVYENFIEGRHHLEIAEKLEKVATGEITRLIVNMPPRHSKSELASYLMPAWFLGQIEVKVIQATHNTELAVRFGRKVRDLIDSEQYGHIFRSTDLKADDEVTRSLGDKCGRRVFCCGCGCCGHGSWCGFIYY